MDDVGQGPDNRNAEEGDAEKNHMQQSYQDDVGQPDAPAIHHSSVGVYFAMCHPHIHPAGFRSPSDSKSGVRFHTCGVQEAHRVFCF